MGVRLMWLDWNTSIYNQCISTFLVENLREVNRHFHVLGALMKVVIAKLTDVWI